MATKQDPPKKRIKDLLKKAMSSGDRTSASQSYKSMAAKKDTVNLAKALRSPKALAAQKIAAAVRPRPMGLKTDSASNMVKALTSPKAKAMRDSTLKAYVAKTGRMPMGLKVDSTKKVMPGGGPKPSVIIKKQTTVKPAKPGVISGPYRPNPESKNKPQVKTLPYKIEYKKDKFGKNQVVKPSNPVKLLKNKK